MNYVINALKYISNRPTLADDYTFKQEIEFILENIEEIEVVNLEQ